MVSADLISCNRLKHKGCQLGIVNSPKFTVELETHTGNY